MYLVVQFPGTEKFQTMLRSFVTKPKKIIHVEILMLRRGEKITKEPRIKLSTIHAAKGGEAENVILRTDISNRIYKFSRLFIAIVQS